jgi:hypothetical protein
MRSSGVAEGMLGFTRGALALRRRSGSVGEGMR